VDVQRERAGIAEAVAAVRGDDQRLAGGDDGALIVHPHFGFAGDDGHHFLDRMGVRRRAGAGGDPLFEDAEVRGAAGGRDAHPGFRAGPPLFRRRVAGVDDLHECVPHCVGWAKALAPCPPSCSRARCEMVGTLRFVHPTTYNTVRRFAEMDG
jgi:hypothetical protein